MLKVRRPGRKTSGFQTVRILKILRASGPDIMSGRALVPRNFHEIFQRTIPEIDLKIVLKTFPETEPEKKVSSKLAWNLSQKFDQPKIVPKILCVKNCRLKSLLSAANRLKI